VTMCRPYRALICLREYYNPSSRSGLTGGRPYRAFWSLMIGFGNSHGGTVKNDLLGIHPALTDRARDIAAPLGLFGLF
jgi:hypothetical protein